MAQIKFTLDMENLKDEVMNSGLEAVVKSSLVLVLNEFMEKERDEYMESDFYQRVDDRKDYRNGYYERDYTVSIGKLQLKVPRTRSGEFSTSLFEKYQRADQSLVLSMLEMVVNGVSTRKVTKIVEQLCGETVSKSFVSSLTAKLDPLVKEWADRPLNITYYKYVYVDAMYIKVREHNKVVSKAVYIAVGVNQDHKREIIGLRVNHAESKEAWMCFFDYLKSRGLQSPRLLISDAHSGLKSAITESFIGTSWQRCTVHFKRNIFQCMPKKGSYDAREMVKSIFDAPNPEAARTLKNEFIQTYELQKAYEKAINTLDEGFEDAIQFLDEPAEARIKIRTTNNLERLNSEIRRRERVIRIFPNNQSAFRLIGAVLMDYEKTLDCGGRKFYFPSESSM
ncbi:IS256 family transposase [Bacillus sp. FJAT-45037]|uniref:IS256 family transposase n=1 Tax=Bacillus sp. FJAT-45037 TaxID=2011007 RepID=UPI000C23F034|nr:IS256 family transposase [Bacillus sp. FJAT-45037]